MTKERAGYLPDYLLAGSKGTGSQADSEARILQKHGFSAVCKAVPFVLFIRFCPEWRVGSIGGLRAVGKLSPPPGFAESGNAMLG
jgi:hypothetical protein